MSPGDGKTRRLNAGRHTRGRAAQQSPVMRRARCLLIVFAAAVIAGIRGAGSQSLPARRARSVARPRAGEGALRSRRAPRYELAMALLDRMLFAEGRRWLSEQAHDNARERSTTAFIGTAVANHLCAFWSETMTVKEVMNAARRNMCSRERPRFSQRHHEGIRLWVPACC